MSAEARLIRVFTSAVPRTQVVVSGRGAVAAVGRQSAVITAEKNITRVVAKRDPVPVVVKNQHTRVVGAGAQGPKGIDGLNGSGYWTDNFVLTLAQHAARAVNLDYTPLDPSKVELVPYGGPEQRSTVDFVVTGNVLSWDGLALELLLDVGSAFSVRYQK